MSRLLASLVIALGGQVAGDDAPRPAVAVVWQSFAAWWAEQGHAWPPD